MHMRMKDLFISTQSTHLQMSIQRRDISPLIWCMMMITAIAQNQEIKVEPDQCQEKCILTELGQEVLREI